MSSQLIEIEDDLSRMKSLLTLLQMATGDLIKEERDALYLGLDEALARIENISVRIADLRVGEAA